MQIRLRILSRLLGSVALLLTVSAMSLPARAGLIFDFELGGVTGTITGLQDDTTGSATSVVVSAAPSAIGLPFEYVDNPLVDAASFINEFTVSGGVIVSGNFNSVFFDTPQPVPFGIPYLLSALNIQIFSETQATGRYVVNQLTNINSNSTALTTIDFVPSGTVVGFTNLGSEVAQVSEPSAIALLGAGVIAFGVLRKKKRKLY